MIRNIQFDSQRLGKLFLDFTKNDGAIYDVIILAGENGCGKTTVLDSISYLFQKHSLRDIECISYDINNHFVDLFNKKQGMIETVRADGETKKRVIALNVINGKDAEYNICLKGFAYSKARSGFKLDSIVSVSTKDIDANNKDFDNDDYSDIKQLLVDIDTIDSRNFHLFSQSHPSLTGKEINTEFDKVSRLSRFKSAFNSFFDTIKFDKIGDPINNSFPILFTKHNKSIDINNLSTGDG